VPAGHPFTMATTSALTDAALLAKYDMADPGYDALYFARLVDQLARKRRCHLKCTIRFDGGEGVTLFYGIEGYDSQAEALITQTDSALSALASCIRILNKRYAKLMQQQEQGS
jgi:hypothetical protein